MAKRNQRRRNSSVYRYTPKRKAALKRAQAISARKRKSQRNAAIKGAVAGATLAGVGAAAIYGYKNRSTIKATSTSWKNAVQPGSKERLRIANAIGGNLIAKPPSQDRLFTKAALDAKWQAKQVKKAKSANKPRNFVAAADPNKVDPSRNNAFPKQQKDVEVVNKLIEGSDRPYNIDKFIPRGVKRLIYGKPVTGAAASRAVQTHVEAKGKIAKEDINASGILHDMIADGSATKVYAGKKVPQHKKPPVKPRNARAGVTKKPRAKTTLADKALEQFIKDFE
jgi:hypothetical protein